MTRCVPDTDQTKRVCGLRFLFLLCLFGVLAVGGASACSHKDQPARHCVPLEQIDAWLESDACDTLATELSRCRERGPELADRRSLNRLQDAATFCHIKNGDCDAAARVTPHTDATRFHISWVATCYQATERFDEAAQLAGEALDTWSALYDHPQALPPLGTCLAGDADEPPAQEEQALQLALCTYLNSSIQSGRVEEIPEQMSGKIRDPNWPILLYDYYLNRRLPEQAEALMDAYLARGGCLDGYGPGSGYTRRTWQRVCYPAIRYLGGIGLCEDVEAIYETVKPRRAEAKDAGILLALANCFLGEGDTQKAREYGAKLRERSGDTYDTHILNGYVSLYDQDLAQALVSFELATDIARRNADAKAGDPFAQSELASALRMHAQALTLMGRPEDADRLVQESWDIANTMLDKDPTHSYWLLSKANSAHFRHDLEEQAATLLQVQGLTPTLGVGDLIEAASLTGRHAVVMDWGPTALTANRHRPAVRFVLLTYIALSHGLCGEAAEAARFVEEIRALAPTLPRSCVGWYVKGALDWAQAHPGPHPTTLLHVLKTLDRCSEGGPAVDVADALDAFLAAAAGEPEGAPMDCR